MSETTQHVVVLAIVALCAVYILWQGFGSFFGRKSKMGSCCAKGCEAPKPQAGAERLHFLPADDLRKR